MKKMMKKERQHSTKAVWSFTFLVFTVIIAYNTIFHVQYISATSHKKNASDVAIIKKLAKEQQERGVKRISDDPNNSRQYGWAYDPSKNESRLVRIFWGNLSLIGDISFAGLRDLRDLRCFNYGTPAEGRGLTSLDISKNNKLSNLECRCNKLTKLDTSGNKQLKKLSCSDNLLTELDFSKNKQLTSIMCGGNPLTNLNVSKNNKLTYLNCGCRTLTKLDLSKNKNLTGLSIWGSSFTELDLSGNKELSSLSCGENKFTNLDFSKNKKLKVLNCSRNRKR